MDKFPSTSEGIVDLNEHLYAMDEMFLKQQAHQLAEDWLSWTAAIIELDVRLLEHLRETPESLRLQIGWSLAACLLGRRPFEIAFGQAPYGKLTYTVSVEYVNETMSAGTMAIRLD